MICRRASPHLVRLSRIPQTIAPLLGSPQAHQTETQTPLSLFLDSFLSTILPNSSTNRHYTSTTSKTTVPTSAVDHIVLLKIKDDTDPKKVNDMINNLSDLFSLGLVLNRTIGPIRRSMSFPTTFTHLIHSRFSSSENLRAYTVHPAHVDVVKEYVLPICDDVVVVDWVVDDLECPLAPPPGSAMRVSLLKLKEGVGPGAKHEILGAIKGAVGKEGFAGMLQFTCGENISPLRAQGYSIASLVLFHGLSDLEALDSDGEALSLATEKIKKHLEGTIVVDYCVPSP